MSKPKLTALPATLFLVGLGLSLHYGYAWWRLPVYTEEDIAASVELNLAVDLQREGLSLPELTTEALRERRDSTLTEVRSEIDRERRDVQQGVLSGGLALLFSIATLLGLNRFRRS